MTVLNRHSLTGVFLEVPWRLSSVGARRMCRGILFHFSGAHLAKRLSQLQKGVDEFSFWVLLNWPTGPITYTLRVIYLQYILTRTKWPAFWASTSILGYKDSQSSKAVSIDLRWLWFELVVAKKFSLRSTKIFQVQLNLIQYWKGKKWRKTPKLVRWLSDRDIWVVINRKGASWAKTNAGVPQGPILGSF